MLYQQLQALKVAFLSCRYQRRLRLSAIMSNHTQLRLRTFGSELQHALKQQFLVFRQGSRQAPCSSNHLTAPFLPQYAAQLSAVDPSFVSLSISAFA